MPNPLLMPIDRVLARRARENAAAAVRADARNAADRREAVTALLAQRQHLPMGRTAAR